MKISQFIEGKIKEAVSLETLSQVAKGLKKHTYPFYKMPFSSKLISSQFTGAVEPGYLKEVVSASFKNKPMSLNTDKEGISLYNLSESLKNKKMINKSTGLIPEMDKEQANLDSFKFKLSQQEKDQIVPHFKNYRDNRKNLTKDDKKAVNYITQIHEGFETDVKPKEALPFFTHLSPNVILKENNILNTLPEELNATKKLFGDIRDREFNALSGLTGINKDLFNKRLSRHNIKNITRLAKNKAEIKNQLLKDNTKYSTSEISLDEFNKEIG